MYLSYFGSASNLKFKHDILDFVPKFLLIWTFIVFPRAECSNRCSSSLHPPNLGRKECDCQCSNGKWENHGLCSANGSEVECGSLWNIWPRSNPYPRAGSTDQGAVRGLGRFQCSSVSYYWWYGLPTSGYGSSAETSFRSCHAWKVTLFFIAFFLGLLPNSY